MKRTKKHNNNKGFTLVELIIVVAIIAVLAAVLAPQYIRYVERSRESNDIQIASAVMDAAVTVINDPQSNVQSGSTVHIRWHSVDDNSQVVGWRSTGTIEIVSGLVTYDYNGKGAPSAIVRQTMSEIMGWYDPTASTTGLAWTGELAQSEKGSTVDFEFTFNTTTGEIGGIPQEWIDMGITP